MKKNAIHTLAGGYRGDHRVIYICRLQKYRFGGGALYLIAPYDDRVIVIDFRRIRIICAHASGSKHDCVRRGDIVRLGYCHTVADNKRLITVIVHSSVVAFGEHSQTPDVDVVAGAGHKFVAEYSAAFAGIMAAVV